VKLPDYQPETVDAAIAELKAEIGRLRFKLAKARQRHDRDASTIARLRPLYDMGVAVESWITSRHWSDEQSQALLTIVKRALLRGDKRRRT
jgi:hypothetical protein